jgi:hypothetical protein
MEAVRRESKLKARTFHQNFRKESRGQNAIEQGEAMKAIFILATLLFVCVSSNGQVRKCKGPDGKITYSDTLCSTNTVSESGVQTNANTMDASTLRQDMSREKAEALEAADRRQTEATVNRAMQAGSSSCKFSYLAIGDEKGKQLADAAKQECLLNIQAKAKGQPISLEQFTYWNSHHQLMTTRRQARVSRILCKRRLS